MTTPYTEDGRYVLPGNTADAANVTELYPQAPVIPIKSPLIGMAQRHLDAAEALVDLVERQSPSGGERRTVTAASSQPVPLLQQARWFLAHIDEIPPELHVPAFKRFVDGYAEYGDSLFRKPHEELQEDAIEELCDYHIYQLAEIYGGELW
jgi:hypothetical protein